MLLTHLKGRSQAVRPSRIRPRRVVRDDDSEPSQPAHDSKCILVGYIVPDIDWEDGLGSLLFDPVLNEPFDGLALVPISGRAQLVYLRYGVGWASLYTLNTGGGATVHLGHLVRQRAELT